MLVEGADELLKLWQVIIYYLLMRNSFAINFRTLHLEDSVDIAVDVCGKIETDGGVDLTGRVFDVPCIFDPHGSQTYRRISKMIKGFLLIFLLLPFFSFLYAFLF